MKKSFLPMLLCLFISLVGCGNNNSSTSSIESEETPAETGADPIETGAYVFTVKDSQGKPVSGAEFSIAVERILPRDTWLDTVSEKYTATSDADGDVTFSLNQLENVETGGDYGLWSMRDVEDKTPEGYKTVTKTSIGDEVSGLYCVDEKGGVYTGSYTQDSYGEYKGYYLHYSYAGEEYSQHAVHQVDLQWTWERTLNGLFSSQISYRKRIEDEPDYERVYQDGGSIKVSMTKAPEGYALMSDSKELDFTYAASGDIYDKYCHSANYVFVSNTGIVL